MNVLTHKQARTKLRDKAIVLCGYGMKFVDHVPYAEVDLKYEDGHYEIFYAKLRTDDMAFVRFGRLVRSCEHRWGA